MNTKVVDDDEELLLLRIKALKSTPRVNISVQFTSDSDNDVKNDIRKKKHHERKTRSSTDKDKLYESNSVNIENDDDDEETKLREIALNSLRKRPTQQSSNVVVLKSNHENQTTIQISQNVAPTTTDSVSFQQVIISSGIVSETNVQESSAIQHDLISSTSEDHAAGQICARSISSVVEPTSSPSMLTDSVKFTCGQSAFNSELKSYQSINSVVTFDQSALNGDSSHSIDFRAEVINKSSAIELNKSLQSDVNNEEPLGNSLITCNQSLHNVITNDEDETDETPLNEKSSNENIFTHSVCSHKITVSHAEDSHEKAVIDSEQFAKNLAHDEESASSASESEHEVPNSTHVDIVIERTYPSFVLKQKFVQSELGEYSPSSPSETDDDDYSDPVVNKTDCNDVYHDDVLSLCASDKDESELDSISLGRDTQTQTKISNTNTTLINRFKTIKGKPKTNYQQNELTDECNTLVSSETYTVKHNTITETPVSKLLDKSGQKYQLDKEIVSSCLAEKDVSSDTCGLNIILDRYLHEVAANKKMSEDTKLNSCTDNEDEYVYSSTDVENSNKGLLSGKNENNWIDCKPGPSGYMPTMMHDYGSDTDDSVTDITCMNGDTTEAMITRKKKLCNASSEDIKNSLEEQNIHEEGKREDLKDVTCSICLGPFENRSFLNSCFHSFCYMCIIQWSELSRLCPLCKTKYMSLIHSVNTDLDYETYEFPDDLPEKEIMPQRREFCETMDDGRRFRYRSTVVDRDEWEARRIERERLEQEYIASRQQRRMKRRLKWSATKDMRKTVYQKKLQVKEVKQRGVPKYRDITPKFFEDNPALKHRLVPWLLRDLNVLLGNEDENIRFVMTLILNLISKLPMNEDAFKEQLRPFLFEQTDHFVDELVSFASSPYDMRGYDKNVKYSKPANDVEITFTSLPAIQISDGESPTRNKFNLFAEVINDEVGKAPLGDHGLEDISPQNDFENISPVIPHSINGFEDISPVNRSPANSDDDEDELESGVGGAVAAPTTDHTASSVAHHEQANGKSDNDSDDMCNQVRKKRHREGKREKKKKRKRKRRRLDSDDASHKKKKKSKKENAKKSRKESDAVDIPLSKDSSGDFVVKIEKHSEPEDEDDDDDDDDDDVGNNGEISEGHRNGDVLPSHSNNDTSKKESDKRKSEHKDKKKRAEQKRKRKHKKKYKYVKHVKRKRRRIKSLSSEHEEVNEKVNSKPTESIEPTNRKKSATEQSKVPLIKKTSSSRRNSIVNDKDDDDDEEKPDKKSLKRRSTSSGTEQERLPKRKRKEKNKENAADAAAAKGKHKKKEKRKRKRHRHKKNTDKNTHVSSSSHNNTETNTCSDKKEDNELRSKIDHAINAIMDTKGGNNSSDDEDEFLNSQEVQDLLSKYKYNNKLDLIKDGDAYKTRAEVVQELLLIEKAITRRKEKKKQKQISQSAKSVSVSGKNVLSQKKDLSEKPNSELLIDKATKKAEREKSYKVLIKELQEIEGRINSCRSSLQVKPSDMI